MVVYFLYKADNSWLTTSEPKKENENKYTIKIKVDRSKLSHFSETHSDHAIVIIETSNKTLSVLVKVEM